MSGSAPRGYAINALGLGAVREYCSPGESPTTCGSGPEVEVVGQRFGAHRVSAVFAGMFALWRFEWMKAHRRKWRNPRLRDKALQHVDSIGRAHAVLLRREIGPGPVIVYGDGFLNPCGGPCEWQVTDHGELVPYRHRPNAGYVIDHEVCGEWAWEFRPAGKYMIGKTVGECDAWREEQSLPWELVKAFNELNSEWSSAVWNGDEHREAFDWESHHAKGLTLALRLKQVVGAAYKVIYMRPYEEPCKQEAGRILEVRLDGTTRDYDHQPLWDGSKLDQLGSA